MHAQSFLLDIAIAIAAGLVGGLAARLLRLPALVGYLMAGVVVGPHTPGVVAESGAVGPAANLGVVLLMFAVGVQFSLHELMAAKRTALVAGGAQIGGTILLGILVGAAFGWSLYAGLFLGCALALSSTAVVMRLLEERGEVGSGPGVVMMGISVVQDLSLVLMAALLPALASLGAPDSSHALADVGLAVAKAAAFLAGVVFLAMRGVPVVLDRVARLGSRELFVLTVVVICLGAAIGAEYAGLGLALGAFLAGIVVSESDFAHEVFAQVRPLRDVFAALFFVSIGMLLDPRFALAHAGAVGLVVAVIVIGKALLIAVPVYLLGWQGRVALTAGLGMAQIGEFSFVLATLGSGRGLIAPEVSSVILSAALITILLTPFLFSAAGPLYRRLDRFPALSRALNHGAQGQPVPPDAAAGHAAAGGPAPRVIVLGYGRVGRYVSDALRAKQVPHVVVEYDRAAVERCRAAGTPVLYGDASSATVLEQTRPREAELAILALPEAASTEMALRALRELAPSLPVVARVHRAADIAALRRAGADVVIQAEFEAATEMIRQGLDRLRFPDAEVDAYIEAVREGFEG